MLIIDRDNFKVVKLTHPFLSQLIAARKVLHKDVTGASKDKNWKAIGLNGNQKKKLQSFGLNTLV